jgi:hypothetical protein
MQKHHGFIAKRSAWNKGRARTSLERGIDKQTEKRGL